MNQALGGDFGGGANDLRPWPPLSRSRRCRKVTSRVFPPGLTQQAAIPPPSAWTVPDLEPTAPWVRFGGWGYVDHLVHRDDGIVAGHGARAELGADTDRRRSEAVRRHVSRSG